MGRERTRIGAAFEQMSKDLSEGIQGKDIVTDVVHGARNSIVALWHGAQSIIPSAANAFSGQRYSVEHRNGPLEGTTNAMGKIIKTKGLLGKASAIFAEATDGPMDDGIHALTGGAEWIVKPVGSMRSRTHNLLSSAA